MLSRLRLSHFRSYESLELLIDEPVFLILGPNATGKTNILEAIYVTSTGKSFRSNEEGLVTHSYDSYSIEAQYDDENIRVISQLRPKKIKNFKRNAVKISRSTLLGRHPVVLFEPNDLNLLSSAPERRRRYLDLVLIQTNLVYRQSFLIYRRLLKQRNSLLWRNRYIPILNLDDQLFILETQISPVAEDISRYRQELLKDLESILVQIVPRIAKKNHLLKTEFIDRSSDFMNRLQKARERDIAVGSTTEGPHREDWSLWFDGYPIYQTASRGETRTALLALKLAELEYIKNHSEDRQPILLLDDVFSELDESRRRQLINELTNIQTIITSTDIDRRLDLPAQTLDLTRPV